MTHDIEAMYTAYHWYRKGFLPAAGGMLDQTHHFVAAVAHLERLWYKFEGDVAEELASKRKG